MRTTSNKLQTPLHFAVTTLWIAVALAWPGALTPAAAANAQQQKAFASPDLAVDALVAASRAGQTGALLKILGPAGKKIIFSGDRVADKEARKKFVAAYDKKHKIDRPNGTTAILDIGEEEWPLPIPIVKQADSWRFDTKAGEDEILNRRIGRNELNAIEVCRAYVDAQREYASVDRTGDGLLEYAQRFVSSPGKHDGLYWPVNAGDEASPMGPLVASARDEGYGGGHARGKRVPYHGYFYRILKQQGPDARGGARDYVVNGHMIGGFALLAFPATYGDSGIMTFIVNQDGVVYQKNLGPNTATLARQTRSFDPDTNWKTP